MKKTILFNYLIFALCIVGNLRLNAMEADFKDGNLNYKITSIEKRECCLFGPVDQSATISKLIVPTTAQYNGTAFTVVGVWGDFMIFTWSHSNFF